MANNEHRAALEGYLALIDHYERTGGWTYQWTTLRNVADLMESRHDAASAAFLRQATSTPPVFPGRQDGTTREEIVSRARQSMRNHLALIDRG